MITFVACAGMLGARVYAVWQKNKFILAILIALSCLEIGAQIGAFIHVKPVSLPKPVHACLPSADSQKLLWAYLATPFLFESVTFLLSLTKTISMIRTARSRVVTVLVRDQIAWFAVAALVNAGNLIAYLIIAPERNRSLMAPVCIAVVSIAVSGPLFQKQGLPQTDPAFSVGLSDALEPPRRCRRDNQLHGLRFLPAVQPEVARSIRYPDARTCIRWSWSEAGSMGPVQNRVRRDSPGRQGIAVLSQL